ncbi:MAG TPA: aspartate/glutamate racemase family protein [Casimicrobiaceae bacterium]|nr:aspartate/glutamate racemase family protein [Casimicrobiaceae bacterium]
MKVVGLIGGMSWESTVPYYQVINRTVAQHLGGLHSAKILLYSVDFDEIEAMQREGRWDDAGVALAEVAQRLQHAGADFLVLCTNTMHKVASAIESRVSIPLLHIADPTAHAITQAGWRTAGLLGTSFTMEQDFYSTRLAQHGIATIVPPPEDRAVVHRVIYEELCRGRVLDESRRAYRRIIDGLARRGAQCIILGCTEIALLVRPSDADIPLFDTAALHARAAALRALDADTT